MSCWWLWLVLSFVGTVIVCIAAPAYEPYAQAANAAFCVGIGIGYRYGRRDEERYVLAAMKQLEEDDARG